MNNSMGGSVTLGGAEVKASALPRSLADRKRIPLADVAALRGKTPEYLRDCIKASRDSSYRKKRRIPQRTLDDLPLRGWFQDPSGRWFIEERDLLSQLTN